MSVKNPKKDLIKRFTENRDMSSPGEYGQYGLREIHREVYGIEKVSDYQINIL